MGKGGYVENALASNYKPKKITTRNSWKMPTLDKDMGNEGAKDRRHTALKTKNNPY